MKFIDVLISAPAYVYVYVLGWLDRRRMHKQALKRQLRAGKETR